MYYIYFPYVVILAFLLFAECLEKKLPRWWAVMVLIAPLTTPYFIFKSRKEEGIVLFTVFLTSFSIMAGSEVFLYSKHIEKNQYLHLPPVTRQMLKLTDNLKKSTEKLDIQLVELEALSKVESRIHEIKKTIEFITTIRITIVENQQAIKQLEKYTTDYKSYFLGKDLAWVFDIQKFYNNRNVVQHYKSLDKYLNDFDELLKYTYVNFYNITEHKNPEHLKNYDQYYFRYRRAVDSHNRLNVKRLNFQNDFLAKHPIVQSYLPGKRQTDTFKLWD